MLPNPARAAEVATSASSVRLRLGLVGAGVRGGQHAATIAGLPDLYEFVAVCDVNEARAQELAQRYTIHAYGGLGELFARERLDAVLIAVPGDVHHVVAKAAADHHVHMLIEVPLAFTRAMMDFIEEAAAKAGVHVEVGENYGRRPAELLNRQVLRDGLIGKLVHLSFFNGPANHHTMSLFRFYAEADVTEVHAFPRGVALDPKVSGLDAERWTEAMVTFENGVIGTTSYVSSWTAPFRWGRPRFATLDGTAGYIVSTSEGHNHLGRVEESGPFHYELTVISRSVENRERERDEIPTRFFYGTTPPMEIVSPFADRVLADAEPGSICDGLGRADELLSLHRSITTGGPARVGTAYARRSQEIAIAIHESARLGKPLAATLGEETGWEREQHELFERKRGAHPIRDVDAIIKGSR